jgi:membrane protein YdbS with pleckstrin-like domain
VKEAVSDDNDKVVKWMYRGVWAVLTGWFKVPKLPPTLPTVEGGFIRSFHPSPRYLDYLKLHFWIAIILINIALSVGWAMLYLTSSFWAWILLPLALVLIVLPDIIIFVALHLRYDTMWYVMTDQSLRCRRGIWTIIEHTITFENVQNVDVHRGPLQYLFGISTIVVETAGASVGEGENEFAVGNKAILEGIENPKVIRELIMERVRQSRSVGLGGEDRTSDSVECRWSQRDLKLLEEIRDEIKLASK